MATLTNPINAQNIVDRFADYVTATANASITYGINSRHFADFVAANMPTATELPQPTTGAATQPLIGLPNAEPYATNSGVGRSIGITGSSISGNPITASTIYNALGNEMVQYCYIRTIRARLNVLGAGGSTGTRPTAGVVSDVSGKAYMSNSWFFINPGVPAAGTLSSGNAISASGLETFMSNLQAYYITVRDSSYHQTVVLNVCHASCHSSCHSSRGRR